MKAILFDLDNTLIDFWSMKRRSCEAAVDAMISAGLGIKRDKALKILYGLYKSLGIEYQRIFQKFVQKTRGKVDYRIVAHGIAAYRRIKNSYMVSFPHAISTLLELKREYKLAIISDAPRMNAWLRLVQLNLDDFFDVVITAADVRKQKQYSTPFNAALKALRVRPEDAIMIGDRVERDIITAKNLGITTCYARYGEEKPLKKGSSGADYEIDDIRELLKIIRRL